MVGKREQSRVYLISLGCPKNRVDSEVMLGHLVDGGFELVDRPEDADIIVVNTCGFIDAAKEESVDTILEMAQHKANGTCRKLVVSGCLSQRYAPALAAEIPEVDHFLGTGNFGSVATVLGGGKAHARLPVIRELLASPAGHRRERGDYHPRLMGRNALVPYRHDARLAGKRSVVIPDPDFTLSAGSPRLRSLPHYTTYVKVSEGCSNSCSFCIIPKIRGPQRSRPVADVVREVERLVAEGVVEINLIAQDLCAYGKDLGGGQSLPQLLRALDAVGGDRPLWIRCLYAYPRGLTTEVLEVMAGARHILPYLDIPLQHINERILRRMRRGKGGRATRDLLTRARATVPGLVLRTAFITGFPSETEAEFEELCDFVREARFEHLGVFTFSPEEDTDAAGFANPVPAEVAAERRERLMALQQKLSREQQEIKVGKTLPVLVEGVSTETELLLQGRHPGQAPEIDGVTYINAGTASPGEVVAVRVTQAADYDLVGGIVPPRRKAAPGKGDAMDLPAEGG
ncbi:MAG: 30S ribosomal protein S12 methylthiotransferase RimO [Deltaproteobacteria bacterium]|nr:30S ribosomal protein S12 methylthiotransferase RimO [Deltaproteobacteria bacterium]